MSDRTPDHETDIDTLLETIQPSSRFGLIGPAKEYSKHAKFDDDRKVRFLQYFMETRTRHAAAYMSGVSWHTVLTHLKQDTEFAAAYKEVEMLVADAIEAEMFRRGIQGIKKLVVQKGEVVKGDDDKPIYETIYSDHVLLALAQAHMPERFGKRLHVDSTVRSGVLYMDKDQTKEEHASQYQNQPVIVEAEIDEVLNDDPS